MKEEEFDMSKVNTNVLSKDRIAKEIDATKKSCEQLSRMHNVARDIYAHSQEVKEQPVTYNIVPLVACLQQIEPHSIRLLLKPLLKAFRQAEAAQKRYMSNLEKFT